MAGQWVLGSMTIGTVVGSYQLYHYYEERYRTHDAIINSRYAIQPAPTHVDRTEWETALKELLAKDDGYGILVSGNHSVGKSDLLAKVLGNRPGIVHVRLMQHGQYAVETLVAGLGAKDVAEAQSSLRAAAKTLQQDVVILLEVPRENPDPKAMMSASAFAKVWGYDDRLARVIVVASAAAAALAFDPDGRKHEVFLPPLTEEEMKGPQVDAFLSHHGGTKAVEHKLGIFELTGGNIGAMEEVAQKLRAGDWKSVKAQRERFLRNEVSDFMGIDAQGGFGPGKVKAARELARAVAKAPFAEGVDADPFRERFTPIHFATAVRAARAHPIFFDAAQGRYRSATLATHAALRR